MPKPVKLPEPPTFPASNFSYSKIADKMHKAALTAATSTAAIAAVTAIRDHVKGVNTYSKKVRKYGDELITALSEGFPEVPGLVSKTGAADMAVAIEAAEEKAAAIAAAKTPKGATVKVSDKPAPAPKALPQAVAEQESMKSFSSKSNAKRALKQLGLDHLPVTFETQPDGQVRPIVSVTDDKGVAYAQERGIAFKVLA